MFYDPGFVISSMAPFDFNYLWIHENIIIFEKMCCIFI